MRRTPGKQAVSLGSCPEEGDGGKKKITGLESNLVVGGGGGGRVRGITLWSGEVVYQAHEHMRPRKETGFPKSSHPHF